MCLHFKPEIKSLMNTDQQSEEFKTVGQIGYRFKPDRMCKRGVTLSPTSSTCIFLKKKFRF